MDHGMMRAAKAYAEARRLVLVTDLCTPDGQNAMRALMAAQAEVLRVARTLGDNQLKGEEDAKS